MEEQREVYGIIYMIRNKINNKLYIGQTTDKKGFNGRYGERGTGIEKVYNHHIKKEKQDKSYNKHLLRSIEKYGFDAFEVNEEFDIAYSQEELNKLEYMYIEIYQCRYIEYGYNNRYGGNNGKLSEETKKKLKDIMTGRYVGENNPNYGNGDKIRGGKNPSARAVYCYEFNQIRLTIKEWCGILNLDMSHILQCCNGGLKTTGGFHFRYATEEEINNYKEEDNIMIDEKEINFIKTKAKLINPMGKCVYCYELNIVTLSTKEMKQLTGINTERIKECCEGKKESFKNYHFRYATEEEINNKIMEIIKHGAN